MTWNRTITRRQALGTLLAVPAGTLLARGAETPVKLARPTPEQVTWQDRELEMFLTYGPATWQGQEYDDLSTPLSEINPTKLDTDQWVETARAMGAGLLLFVAKHTGGFCWWQTNTTTYGVKETPWRGGKGDVMKDLAASCRKAGIKLGVYLSPQDLTLGAALSGRCKTPEAQARYNAIFRQQLTELLSRYGKISEVWFDGSAVVEVGDILKQYAPKAMIFQGKYATIRWVGNEDGLAPDPGWNSVWEAAARSGTATAQDSTPDGDTWLPIECDAMIRSGWFWRQANTPTLKSLDDLMAMYYRSVGHGAVLLLNNTPDTTGLIPEADVRRSAEFGEEIRRRFSHSIAETRGEGDIVELKLAQPARIDHVVLMEDIREGERVREYRVEGMVGNQWQELSQGTAIGHKKIDPFKAVEVAAVRFRAVQAAARPLLQQLAVYDVGRGLQELAVESERYAFRVVHEWKAFSGTKQAWLIDLTRYCNEARQYELEFVITGGGLQVHSLALVHDGVELPDFVKPGIRRNTYLINITGLSASMQLKAVVSSGPELSYGQVTLRKVF
jgi:alpha-L-fucosidase